jgi:zinc finger protein
MSTNCAICGYRDNEVKSGGAISDKGKRITLKVQDADDLTRDILKVSTWSLSLYNAETDACSQSETCGLSIPEIDLVLQPGTLGGRFSTLEGILTQVFEELNEKVFAGDSNLKSDLADDRTTFEKFLGSLKEVCILSVLSQNSLADLTSNMTNRS